MKGSNEGKREGKKKREGTKGREEKKGREKSGWNTLARHAENIPSEQRFIPYLAGHSFGSDCLIVERSRTVCGIKCRRNCASTEAQFLFP